MTEAERLASELLALVQQGLPARTRAFGPYECEGRSLHLDAADPSEVRILVHYGEWYAVSATEGVTVKVPGKQEFQPVAAEPTYSEAATDSLRWALAHLPRAIARVKARTAEAARLTQELERWFPRAGLDGGVSLSQALLQDDYVYDPARLAEVYKNDTTHDWQSVEEAELSQAFLGLSVYTYLDDKGWKYYLPAALRSILRDPHSDCEFWTRISLLDSSEKKTPETSVEETARFLSLNEKQGRVVAKILCYMRGIDPDWYAEHPRAEALIAAWTSRFGVG